MTYNSKTRLPISEKPLTTDPDIFPDLNDLYNAVHLLNQILTLSSESMTSGETQKDPWLAIPIKNWIWAQAGEAIPKGSIVTPLQADRYRENNSNVDLPSGYYKGCGNAQDNLYSGAASPARQKGNGFIGFALEESTAPGDIIRIGIGPTVLKVDGVSLGDVLYVCPAIVYDGSLSAFVPTLQASRGNFSIYPFKDYLPIGYGVAENAVMFGMQVDAYTYHRNSSKPVPPESGNDN